MSAFYSKSRKDKNDELAKIELKRYEEIMQQEKNNRKKIASVIKSSIENEKEIGLSRPVRAKRDSAKNPDEEKDGKINPPETVMKSSTPLSVKPSDNNGLNTPPFTSMNPIQSKPPRIKPIKGKLKVSKKEEFSRMNNEYHALEEEEALVEASLERIDLQVYKKKVMNSMLNINEDTKELEEFVGEKPNFLNENLGHEGNDVIKEEHSENNETYDDAGNLPYENRKISREIGKKQENKRGRYANKPPIPEKNSEFAHPDTPFSNDFNFRDKEKVALQSVYSDKSQKSRYSYKSYQSKNSRKLPKPRHVSRDYVRVNPNVNIRSLLYS